MGEWQYESCEDLIRDMVQYESHGDIQGDLGCD